VHSWEDVIELSLYDKDKVGTDDFMGMVRLGTVHHLLGTAAVEAGAGAKISEEEGYALQDKKFKPAQGLLFCEVEIEQAPHYKDGHGGHHQGNQEYTGSSPPSSGNMRPQAQTQDEDSDEEAATDAAKGAPVGMRNGRRSAHVGAMAPMSHAQGARLRRKKTNNWAELQPPDAEAPDAPDSALPIEDQTIKQSVPREVYHKLLKFWDKYVAYIESVAGVKVSYEVSPEKDHLIVFSGSEIKGLWCAKALLIDLEEALLRQAEDADESVDTKEAPPSLDSAHAALESDEVKIYIPPEVCSS